MYKSVNTSFHDKLQWIKFKKLKCPINTYSGMSFTLLYYKYHYIIVIIFSLIFLKVTKKQQKTKLPKATSNSSDTGLGMFFTLEFHAFIWRYFCSRLITFWRTLSASTKPEAVAFLYARATCVHLGTRLSL